MTTNEFPTEQNARHRPVPDPETSHWAAQSMVEPAKTNRLVILACYADAPGGLTYEEASVLAGYTTWATSKRCSELKHLKYIEWVEGEWRKGTSGRKQRVSRITSLGRECLRDSSVNS